MESKEVEELAWYHGNITRHAAEALLVAGNIDGSYLLRSGEDNPQEYRLSVKCQKSVKHFKIPYNGTEYTFGMAKFSNLCDFVHHFENQPLIGGESGVLTVLKHPYPKHVDEPSEYESVRVHAELGLKENNVLPDFTLASKEGYLTKQGGNIKNWKTRWIVLNKNELKYFRDRLDKEPIKTLDLRECSSCVREFTKDKHNCFRLVFPWRTYYMYAGTEEETIEWIKIINWKLKNS